MSDKEGKLSLTVNGTRKIVSVASTRMDSWSTDEWISIEVDLNEGINAVVISPSELNGGSIDVDRFEVTMKRDTSRPVEGFNKNHVSEPIEGPSKEL